MAQAEIQRHNPNNENLLQRDLLQRDLHLVQITDAAFADAAQRSGPHLVCKPGCTQCCHGAFAIHALDAWRLRQGFKELAQRDPYRAQAVRTRAEQYIRVYASTFPGDPVSGILGLSEAEQEAFEEFANEAACPALDPASGLCDLYTARPMTCRVFGPPVRSMDEDGAEGLGHCELCFIGATPEQVAACEMPVPGLGEELVEEFEQSSGRRGHTLVAFALAR